jgi:acyl-coenzyme A thioesterase PaaI-like protein
MESISIAPRALDVTLDAEVREVDGWLERDLHVPAGLDGPEGILQGGFAAGMLIGIAQAVDPIGAPVTSVEARLRRPTPTGRTIQARVRPGEATARYEVETRDGDTVLVRGEVELAGHEPAAHAHDLAELATVPLPEPIPPERFERCWVCGRDPHHPHAQRLHPGWVDEHTVVSGWAPDDALADDTAAGGVLAPLIVAAVLDCPTAWVCVADLDAAGMTGPLLGGFHLRFVRDAPVMEPLRTVARLDTVDGRRLTARAALVDEDGVVYAVATATQIGMPVPPADTG